MIKNFNIKFNNLFIEFLFSSESFTLIANDFLIFLSILSIPIDILPISKLILQS